MIDTRQVNLNKLDSMTKYPSILTYHKLDPKSGSLLDEVLVPLDGDVIGTEKVDGCNARCIFMPDKMFILGSREELLYGRGDLIENPKEGIVRTLKHQCTQIADIAGPDEIVVMYVEVFGGNVGGSGKAFRQYTSTNQFGFRVFDIAVFSSELFHVLLDWRVEQYSGWRERGGQPFIGEADLQKFCEFWNIGLTPRVPLTPIPTGLADTYEWLKQAITTSGCQLDGGAGGKPEGLVVRSADRKKIAKIRFEDYERTFRRRQG